MLIRVRLHQGAARLCMLRSNCPSLACSGHFLHVSTARLVCGAPTDLRLACLQPPQKHCIVTAGRARLDISYVHTATYTSENTSINSHARALHRRPGTRKRSLIFLDAQNPPRGKYIMRVLLQIRMQGLTSLPRRMLASVQAGGGTLKLAATGW